MRYYIPHPEIGSVYFQGTVETLRRHGIDVRIFLKTTLGDGSIGSGFDCYTDKTVPVSVMRCLRDKFGVILRRVS